MEPLILKKEPVWYYTVVIGMFSMFGMIGGAVLYGYFLFWPLLVILLLFVSISLFLKDGRYFEFYEDKVVIASDIPLQGRQEIKTIEYSNVDKISRKLRNDGSGGEGIKLDLQGGEIVILYTGFMSRSETEKAIEMIKHGNPVLLLNKEAREAIK